MESTGEPLWFNNAITDYKVANDDHYLVIDGWVPRDGRWHTKGTRFPAEFCVIMPESAGKNGDGVPDRIPRVDGAQRETIDRIIDKVEKYDDAMEKEGLIRINRDQ
jgi:hypothetical protein